MEYTDKDYARLYNTSEPAPRRLSLREFLLLALVAVALGALSACDDGQAAEVTALIEAEARACIAQRGPGQTNPPMQCASGVRDPRHILTHPLSQKP